MTFSLAGGRLPIVQSPPGIAFRERRRAGNFYLWKKDLFSGKTRTLKFENASCDADSASTTAASHKVLVPDAQSDSSSLSTNIGNQEVASDTQSALGLKKSDALVVHFIGPRALQTHNKVSEEEEKKDGNTDDLMASLSSESINEMQSGGNPVDKSSESFEEPNKYSPPSGNGQRIYEIDSYLQGHREHLDYREEHMAFGGQL